MYNSPELSSHALVGHVHPTLAVVAVVAAAAAVDGEDDDDGYTQEQQLCWRTKP
jgi:hypothetical protein